MELVENSPSTNSNAEPEKRIHISVYGVMYYDLIASLPKLPYFEHADRLPITPLRLQQRMHRLRPEHADQLHRATPLVRWRAERLTATTDEALMAIYHQLIDSQLDVVLRDYIVFRMTQQTLLAALRRKRDGLGLPEGATSWRGCPHIYHIRAHWELPHFGLEHVYPWLPQVGEQLSAKDAMGLERLKAEVLRICGRTADMQVFEDTNGVQVGNRVELSDEMLSATLGPGLLGRVFDGLQNPLHTMADEYGFFLPRGVTVPPLDMDREWDFTPVAQVGSRIGANWRRSRSRRLPQGSARPN